MGIEAAITITLLAIPMSAALVIVVAFLRGRINVRGLVSDRDGVNSPARWQLLFVTGAAAIAYLVEAVGNTKTNMPDLPGWFTSAMVASNAIYLFGKGTSFGAFDSIVSGFRSLWRVR